MLPEVKKAVLPASPSDDGPSKVVVSNEDFIVLVDCGTAVEDFHWLLELLLFFLKHPPDEPFVPLIIAILDAHILTFKAMNEQKRVVTALLDSFRFWKSRGKIHRATVRLLDRLGEEHQEVKEAVRSTFLPSTSFTAQVMPPHLPEVAELTRGEETALAQELRQRYGSYEFWGQTVWQNVVDSILSSPTWAGTDTSERIDVLAVFLDEIDWRLAGGLAPVIIEWFRLDPDFTSAHPLAQAKSNLLVDLLIALVHRNVVPTKDLLKDVVLSAWNETVEIYGQFSAASFDDSDSTIIRNLCLLTAILLAGEPVTPLMKYRCVGGRNEYYEKDEGRVSTMIAKTVVLQALSKAGGKLELAETMDALRHQIIRDPSFLHSFNSNVETNTQLFLAPLSLDGQDLRPTGFEVLQEICDGHPLDISNFNWDVLFAKPSVWSLPAMSVSLQSKLELISKGTTPSPQDMDPRFAAAKSLVSRIMDETGSVLEELISSLPIEVSQHVALICLGWMAEADLEASKSTQLERILSLLIQSSKLNRPTLVNQSEPVLSAFLQDWQTSMAYWSSPCDLTRNGENVKAHLARLLLVFRCAPLWMCPNGKLLNNCLADIFKWAIACTLEPQPSDPQFFDILVDCMHTILQDAGPQMRSHAIHSIGAEYHQAREQPRPFPMSEHHHTRITAGVGRWRDMHVRKPSDGVGSGRKPRPNESFCDRT
ncbi:hypothetical protein BT69DRAFT_474255 [Atractiella rhizophila]|nr:hypothetical protein BT69DRAFT_474255 [Atractiella rhizophila]